eukprot:1160049-Pelagomonas_calceolata.AAC.3
MTACWACLEQTEAPAPPHIITAHRMHLPVKPNHHSSQNAPAKQATSLQHTGCTCQSPHMAIGNTDRSNQPHPPRRLNRRGRRPKPLPVPARQWRGYAGEWLKTARHAVLVTCNKTPLPAPVQGGRGCCACQKEQLHTRKQQGKTAQAAETLSTLIKGKGHPRLRHSKQGQQPQDTYIHPSVTRQQRYAHAGLKGLVLVMVEKGPQQKVPAWLRSI